MIDTKTVLLQALMDGDSYGLELIERVRTATDGRIVLLQGRVYPVLRDLEEQGLVSSYDAEPSSSRGGRPRRYYRLTAEGRRVARQEAAAISLLIQTALGAA
jgi:PadR family transcriptional regulator PadR